MKCRSCGNTVDFTHTYDAIVTQTVSFLSGFAVRTDTDIDTGPWDSMMDDWNCKHCLSDDIDIIDKPDYSNTPEYRDGVIAGTYSGPTGVLTNSAYNAGYEAGKKGK